VDSIMPTGTQLYVELTNWFLKQTKCAVWTRLELWGEKNQTQTLKKTNFWMIGKEENLLLKTGTPERRLWWGGGWPLLPRNSNRMRGNSLKLSQRKFRLDIREKNSPERAVMQWHSCTGKWWGHHPWRCSRNVEMWHWGMWWAVLVVCEELH